MTECGSRFLIEKIRDVSLAIDFKRLTSAVGIISFSKMEDQVDETELLKYTRLFYLWRIYSFDDLKRCPTLRNYWSFEKDINLIMAQVHTTRQIAFYSLVRHDFDVVNAIMGLHF